MASKFDPHSDLIISMRIHEKKTWREIAEHLQSLEVKCYFSEVSKWYLRRKNKERKLAEEAEVFRKLHSLESQQRSEVLVPETKQSDEEFMREMMKPNTEKPPIFKKPKF